MNKFFATFALVVSTAALSQAGTVTYDTLSSPATNVIPTVGTNWTNAILLPQFNASLGTLTGLEITLSGNLFGSISATNYFTEDPEVDGPGTGDATIRANISGSFSTASVSVSPSVFRSFSLGIGDTASFPELSNTDSASTGLLTDQNLLNSFIGNSTVSFAVTSAGASVSNTSGGYILVSLSTDAGASAAITYTYDEPSSETPEPATWLLLGTSLVGSGLLRRKRA